MPHFSIDIKLVWECCEAASVNAGVSCGVIQERHVCRGFCLGPVVLDDGEECLDCVMYLSAWPCAQLIGGQRVICFGVLCQSVQENSLEEFGQGTPEIERYDAGSVFSLFPPLYIGCRRESSHALGCISWCHSELRRSCRSVNSCPVNLIPKSKVNNERFDIDPFKAPPRQPTAACQCVAILASPSRALPSQKVCHSDSDPGPRRASAIAPENPYMGLLLRAYRPVT